MESGKLRSYTMNQKQTGEIGTLQVKSDKIVFSYKKDGKEDKVNGKDVTLIKIKPTSFIITAIVDPLLFTFDKEGSRILEVNGRTLPKEKTDRKWKDLDADIVYRY